MGRFFSRVVLFKGGEELAEAEVDVLVLSHVSCESTCITFIQRGGLLLLAFLPVFFNHKCNRLVPEKLTVGLLVLKHMHKERALQLVHSSSLPAALQCC